MFVLQVPTVGVVCGGLGVWIYAGGAALGKLSGFWIHVIKRSAITIDDLSSYCFL